MKQRCGVYIQGAVIRTAVQESHVPVKRFVPVKRCAGFLKKCDDCGAGTVKPVLSGHSKIDKTNIFKTNGSLMKVESIAECSLGAFCNTFNLH